MTPRAFVSLLAVILATVLIGCGGNAASPTPTTTTATPTPTTPTPAPAPTPTPTPATTPSCSYSFQTLDAPGADAVGTNLSSINDNGVIVGSAGSHGVIYRNGQFSTLDVPASYNAFSTSLSALANNGLMAGSYSIGSPGNSQVLGFVYDGSNFTKINEDAHYVGPTGINSSGVVVGSASFIGGISTAWIRQPDGTVQSFGDPSHIGQEYPGDINDNGVVIGGAQDTFYFSSQNNGNFSYHDAPAQLQPPPTNGNTAANGNNNNGDIVGWWGNSGAITSFALFGSTTCTLAFPGASETRAEDVNDSRVIVGEYRIGAGLAQLHGFIATPK